MLPWCVCGEPTIEGGGIQMIGELFIKDHPTNCIYICGGGGGVCIRYGECEVLGKKFTFVYTSAITLRAYTYTHSRYLIKRGNGAIGLPLKPHRGDVGIADTLVVVVLVCAGKRRL